jgi:hypothetical protein
MLVYRLVCSCVSNHVYCACFCGFGDSVALGSDHRCNLRCPGRHQLRLCPMARTAGGASLEEAPAPNVHASRREVIICVSLSQYAPSPAYAPWSLCFPLLRPQWLRQAAPAGRLGRRTSRLQEGKSGSRNRSTGAGHAKRPLARRVTGAVTPPETGIGNGLRAVPLPRSGLMVLHLRPTGTQGLGSVQRVFSPFHGAPA